MRIILALVAAGSIASSTYYCIEHANSSDFTQIIAVEKFNGLYGDMMKQDFNLPTPHVFVEDIENIPKFYMDYKGWRFNCEGNKLAEHYTHVISRNITVNGYKMLTYVNFEKFNMWKMQVSKEPRWLIFQRDNIQFTNTRNIMSKCRGPPHP